MEEKWWAELTAKEQEQYLQEHPGSKLVLTHHGENKNTNITREKWLRPGMKLAANDRHDLPQHIVALKLPPGWKNLQFNPDPEAKLQALGIDAKGRDQYVYSKDFVAENQAMKFTRIREADKKFTQMLEQTQADQKSDDPVKAEHAFVAELIFRTGIRPGSNEDTGADKKAYGATTLEARHIVATEDGVRLQFTGKKGVDLNLPISDSNLSQMLLKRAASREPDAKLFKVSDESLRDYVRTLDGGDFKPKDIRTALGTRMARYTIKKIPVPTNMKEYKAAVLQVGKTVSQVLGNTAAVALTSYIDPTLFTEWRSKAGVT